MIETQGYQAAVCTDAGVRKPPQCWVNYNDLTGPPHWTWWFFICLYRVIIPFYGRKIQNSDQCCLVVSHTSPVRLGDYGPIPRCSPWCWNIDPRLPNKITQSCRSMNPSTMEHMAVLAISNQIGTTWPSSESIFPWRKNNPGMSQQCWMTLGILIINSNVSVQGQVPKLWA